MNRFRVIPVLLIHKGGLVKSIKFRNYKYIGDPINAVRIFNEKEVDELIVLDIDASREGNGPDFNMLKKITNEAFIPFAFGGGISTIEHVKELFYCGVEKVVINSAAFTSPNLISEAAKLAGSQSVVVSVDVRNSIMGKYSVYYKNARINTGFDPLIYCQRMVDNGAGEIFLTAVNRDGTYRGYDLEIIKKVSCFLSVPVIVCGGAGKLSDFKLAIRAGASAVAAGSLFVLQKPHKAVLISYPSQDVLNSELFENL